MTLQTIDARTEQGESLDRLRQQALALVQAGLPISAKEFAALQRIGISHFHKRAKAGAFDDFLLPGALGTKRYSGVKVQRWLNGELIDEPRPFGRKGVR